MDFPLQYAITRRFTLGTPRNLIVDKTGASVTFLRSRAGNDPVQCLWRLDVGSGQEGLVVDPRSLGDSGGDRPDELPPAERARRERARESAGGIVAYALDDTATRATFALGGSLYVTDLATGETAALGTGGAVYDPRFDPTGTTVAYVSGNDLRLVDADGSPNDRLLASDDDPLVSWGRAEFIAAEEMQRSRGYWWSPDGTSLVVTRVDNAPVDKWWIGDPANPAAEPTEVRYPAAGTSNAAVGLWLTDLAGLRTEIDWSEGGSYEYLCDVVWTDGHAPLVVRQTRDQRLVSMATVDVESLRLTEVRAIVDDTWVELVPGSPTWSEQGLVTVEDSTEHRQLCLDGVPLTDDGLEVQSVVTVKEDRAIVTAWTDPTEIHVIEVPLDGSAPNRLTTTPGVHAATVGGPTIVHSWSTPESPGTNIRVGVDGPSIENLSQTPVLAARPRFHGVGGELRSAMFLPDEHDGETPLPVLLDPYGGPHAQRVLKTHNAHLVSQWFADQGFAVVVTDGRGTPGRGPKFERRVSGDLAQPVLDDQIEALDRLAVQTGLLDLDRVAIRGWSFGGYLAALAVLRRPDRFHAAIAGAPVTSWRLYDTHYTERYLGQPAEHPEHYDGTDLILEADALRRPLLLIHGLADDNVVAAHTLQLSTALLAAGRPHAVLPLSGVTHMTPQESIAQNLLLVQSAFLNDSLSVPAIPGVG